MIHHIKTVTLMSVPPHLASPGTIYYGVFVFSTPTTAYMSIQESKPPKPRPLRSYTRRESIRFFGSFLTRMPSFSDIFVDMNASDANNNDDHENNGLPTAKSNHDSPQIIPPAPPGNTLIAGPCRMFYSLYCWV